VAITDEIIGVCQLLENTCPGCPSKVYAYDDDDDEGFVLYHGYLSQKFNLTI